MKKISIIKNQCKFNWKKHKFAHISFTKGNEFWCSSVTIECWLFGTFHQTIVFYEF